MTNSGWMSSRSFQIPEDFCRCSNQDICQAGFTTFDETMVEPTPVFHHVPYLFGDKDAITASSLPRAVITQDRKSSRGDVLKPEADEDVVWVISVPGFPLSNGLKCSAGANIVPVEFLSMCPQRSCGVFPEVSGASSSAQEVLFQGNATQRYIVGKSFSRADVVTLKQNRVCETPHEIMES